MVFRPCRSRTCLDSKGAMRRQAMLSVRSQVGVYLTPCFLSLNLSGIFFTLEKALLHPERVMIVGEKKHLSCTVLVLVHTATATSTIVLAGGFLIC